MSLLQSLVDEVKYVNENYYWWVRASLWTWSAPGWYYLFNAIQSLGNPLPWTIVMLSTCVIAMIGSNE